MTVQLELWQLITLLLAFFGATGTFGKVLFAQLQRHIDGRFAAQDRAREDDQKAITGRFEAIDRANREESAQWQRVERGLLEMKAELPLQYVRREDYVRNQTVIEAKMDQLLLKIENLQLKGGRND